MIGALTMNETAYHGENSEDNESCLGKYRELRLIGEGGSGRVYRAFDPDMKSYIALKVLNPEYRSSSEHRQLFQREIQLQSQLDLPGLVKVFECGETASQLYYTMELVKGVSIDKYCQRRNLSVPAILKLVAEAAYIVSKLHERDITHRDIKPHNVMIDEQGKVKLLDLGVASLIREDDLFAGDFGISGSPGYLAPEIFNAPKYSITNAVDVYALGVMTYELLSRESPYDIDFLSLKEIGEVISLESPKPLKLPSGKSLPAGVEEIIMQAMYIAPSARPSAAEFAEALSYGTVRNVSRYSLAKATAIIGGIIISGGIIWWLMLDNSSGIPEDAGMKQLKSLSVQTQEPIEKEGVKPNVESKANNAPLSIPEKYKEVEPVRSGAFFYDAAPKELRDEWKNARSEVVKKGGLRGQGALLIDIPADTLLRVKRRLKEVFRMDARFEKNSCLYRLGDDKLTLELYHENWDAPKVYHWQSVAGKVDVFQPEMEKIPEKQK